MLVSESIRVPVPILDRPLILDSAAERSANGAETVSVPLWTSSVEGVSTVLAPELVRIILPLATSLVEMKDVPVEVMEPLMLKAP